MFAAVRARSNALLSYRLGETLYILGYVATISGLGAVAWQIGQNPSLLSPEKIPGVLARGAVALFSTVIGLIGMNLLRSHGQSLDLQRGVADEEAQRFAEQIEQILKKTEVERAQTFLNAFQAADLTRQLTAMTNGLKATSECLAVFKGDSEQAKQSWGGFVGGDERRQRRTAAVQGDV